MSDVSSIRAPEPAPMGLHPRVNRLADFVKSHQQPILFAGVCLQAIVLIAMIAIHAAPYLVGERIILKVVPIDPRDFFRGDYVILGYEANRLPAGGIPGIAPPRFWWSRRDRSQESNDKTVYVTVEPDADGRHWHAKDYSTEMPSTGKYLRGKYSSSNVFGAPITYGIEAYYVQEGEGQRLEQRRNSQHLSAEIAVAPWGQAKLVRLIEE